MIGALLAVERIGYLVPAGDFAGAVHSVFARACNIACDELLLTLVAPELGDGPTTLRLGRGAPADLRLHFRPGDHVRCRAGHAQSRGVVLRLADAMVWRPTPTGSTLSAPQIAANLRIADAALARHRRTYSSVVDREGGTALAGLSRGCRDLNMRRASTHIERLIGWGEGLTPAGDDLLVGWCAALDALAGEQVDRRHFLRDFSAAIAGQVHRTTPIAAHYLRLAAQGHFNADVMRLRNALLCEQDPVSVEGALDDALAIGATSGADMVTGMIAGFSAWNCYVSDPDLDLR